MIKIPPAKNSLTIDHTAPQMLCNVSHEANQRARITPGTKSLAACSEARVWSLAPQGATQNTDFFLVLWPLPSPFSFGFLNKQVCSL